MALGTEAAREGFYRFLRNEKVTSEAILEPHISATVGRCAELDTVLVVHDTTQFQYGGEAERPGLGTTNNKQKGFFGHFALALDTAASNRPLGVVGMKTFSRTQKKYSRGTRAAYLRRLRHDPTKESLRWGDLVESVEAAFQGHSARPIHVMDRESDSYVLLARMHAVAARYVIRVTAKRKLFPLGPGEPVAGDYEDWEDFPDIVEREVQLSARHKTSPYYCSGRHPVRQGRVAKLRFSAKTIRAKRCSNIPAKWPASLELNAVRVYEVDAPKGEEAVEWLLLTTERIKTKAEVARIVDIYRARWTIEEYFKALKTGCAIEQRQLESYATLKNALAVLAPIAWKLLLLRGLDRDAESIRAADVASDDQIDVLREFSPKPPPRRPTAVAVMQAIAALGGHITNNGRPGWQVLWRGYQELLTLEKAWVAARRLPRCTTNLQILSRTRRFHAAILKSCSVLAPWAAMSAVIARRPRVVSMYRCVLGTLRMSLWMRSRRS
jgi:Transposase DDE domain